MIESNPSQNVAIGPPGKFHDDLRKLDRRQWFLSSSTALVLILLTVGVASFAFPALLNREQSTYSFFLNQAVRSLVGLVLAFHGIPRLSANHDYPHA